MRVVAEYNFVIDNLYKMYVYYKIFRPVCCLIPAVYAKTTYDFPDDRRLYDEQKVVGMEAVYNMFGKDKYGSISKEMASVLQITFGSACLGFAIGGLRDSKSAALEFVERNDVSKFISHYEAKRKAQDYVIGKFMIHGFQWAAKLAVFSFFTSLVVTMSSVYNGTLGVSDFVLTGVICGAGAKSYLGLKGAVSGAVTGGIVATVFGSIIVALLKYQGESMDEVRQWQLDLRRKREMNLEGRTIPQDTQAASASEQLMIRESNFLARQVLDKEMVYIQVNDPNTNLENNAQQTTTVATIGTTVESTATEETNKVQQIVSPNNNATENN